MERTHLTGPLPRVVVSCEHASNAVPADLDLGVEPAVLASHVAWDPGAEPLARALAAAHGTTPFLGEWTRLAADLNRPETSPAAIPTVAFGVAVPGNIGADRGLRLERYHRPYWARVEAAVEAALELGGCIHVSVHSFDGDYLPDSPNGQVPRDFDLGLLYDPTLAEETRLAVRLERPLAAAGLRVRHNQPYAGVDEGLVQTLRQRHASRPYIGIELELNQATVAARGRADPKLIKGLLAVLKPPSGT
ncbi:MAG TPA: N-formylglutamate amidohydrolase [Kofleriaceae bacterium]|nr:N-formylglutamate amidohydrolase [Kofleriaceae bacterium]